MSLEHFIGVCKLLAASKPANFTQWMLPIFLIAVSAAVMHSPGGSWMGLRATMRLRRRGR